jgi:hypothetical protein
VNQNSVTRRAYKRPPHLVLYWNARNRAKAKGIPFDLEPTDLMVPSHCPVLGIPLVICIEYARDNSPSVDRINPALGYVKGNVCVISHKANTIKSNGTADDLRAVLQYVERGY